eukprot:GHVH01012211.1.p1 GENE.GHVH01012211.1~~GHVH01012211.1.p1  ORF type:complete len:103 (-),score=11.55 GHVH01012211.1:346-621(-)
MTFSDFQAAADFMSQPKDLNPEPSNDELLKIYSLFKQATVGDCDTKRPGMTDFKGKAKWDAYNALKGTSSDDAKAQYLEFVNTVILPRKQA